MPYRGEALASTGIGRALCGQLGGSCPASHRHTMTGCQPVAPFALGSYRAGHIEMKDIQPVLLVIS